MQATIFQTLGIPPNMPPSAWLASHFGRLIQTDPLPKYAAACSNPDIAVARRSGLECRHVRDLLPRAQSGRRSGNAARISDVDGGDGAGHRRPPRRGLLLSVACRAV